MYVSYVGYTYLEKISHGNKSIKWMPKYVLLINVHDKITTLFKMTRYVIVVSKNILNELCYIFHIHAIINHQSIHEDPGVGRPFV